MKKWSFLAVLAIVTALLALPAIAGEPAPVKIGAIFPISGANADSGKLNLDGVMLAAKHINDRGGIKSLGGAKIEIVSGDCMSDTNQCKAVAERILQDKSIMAVTGASASSFVLPMLPVFEKSRTPFITAQLALAICNQGYQWIFETTGNSNEFAAAQVNFMKYLNSDYGLNINKVAIVYENTEWGQSNAAGAAKLAKEAGMDVVFNESFPVGLPDASSLVTALKNMGAEVMLPIAYAQDCKTLFSAMRSLRYSPIIIGGGGGIVLPSFAEEIGSDIEGVVSSSSSAWDTTNIINNPEFDFVAADFLKEYGVFMTEQSVASYNIIWMLGKALEKAGSRDKRVLRDTIRALDIESMTIGGPLKFDETGYNTNGKSVMVQWQKQDDGTFIPRTVYPPEYSPVKYILPEGMRK